MCSKRGISLAITIFAVGAAIAIVGCGLKTGEKAPAQNPPSFNGKGYSCVGQIPQHLGQYAADELSEGQITDFMRCLQKAFSTFAQLTRGAEGGSYSPEEIRRFLQTYFLRERPISDKLLHEFMVVKQVFVGGSIDRITRPELAELIEILENVRGEAIRLKPHLKFLNPRLIVNQDPKDVGQKLGEANETLKASIRVFAARLQKGQRHYPFENLKVLITEFRYFARWDEHFKDAHPAQNWVNFLKLFKQTAVTPLEPDVIRISDWTPFLQSLSRWYLAFIQYQVGVKSQPLLYGVGLQNTMHLAQELFELTEQAINRQENKSLSMLQFTSLVTAAQDLRWISPSLRAKSVDKALHAMFDRMFSDEKANPLTNRADGLNLPTLTLIKYEFYRWAYIQMQLNTNFNNETRLREEVRPKVPNLQTNFLIPPDVRARLRTLRDADWEHFLKIKKLARPLFNDNLNRVTLVPDEDLARFRLTHEFNNLSMMNLLRSAVGVLFRGYAADGRHLDWSSGLRSDELQRFYMDVRDLAVDMALADNRTTNVGSRAFIEGNLFTYAADGISFDLAKSKLSYVETMELLAFLYSGSRTANDFYLQLSKLCPKGGGVDQNGDPKLDRACVGREMANLIVDYGANMPGMNAFMRSAPPAERTTLVENLIDSAFSPKNSDTKWVERNELSIMAVVLHYLEAVLTRFDANRDGSLTNLEIRNAIPVFTGYIQKFAKDQMKTNLNPREAEAVFLYILKFKQVPGWLNLIWHYNLTWDMRWEIDFGLGLKTTLDLNKQISLNRSQLSTVFRVIVAKIFDTVPVAQQIQLMKTGPAPCQLVMELGFPECGTPKVQP